MVSFKGHFDGKSIVLDEPATLEAGQSVRVVVENVSVAPAKLRKPRFGFGRGKFKFELSQDFHHPLDEFAEYR